MSNEFIKWRRRVVEESCDNYTNAKYKYLLKVNNRNNRKRCEIYTKLTIKTPERQTYFAPLSSVSIVDFEQVNVCWEGTK